MTRSVPIIPTIIVLAAVATMIGLGIWQLGRRAEKEALIARYEAALAQQGESQLLPGFLLDPSSPEAAYTRTLQFCSDPEQGKVVSGRNSTGRSGWVRFVRCTIGQQWPHTQSNCAALYDVFAREIATPQPKAVFVADCIGPDVEPDPFDSRAPRQAEIVLGWSKSPEAARWSGGFVTGTIVPAGEFGFKIVADPPIAGLQPNAKPDPGDLPNNHLAYAAQWFFFALTALVIYVLALKRRRRVF